MNGFFLFQHFGSSDKKGPQGRGPSNFIAKQLKFDNAQMVQFEKLDTEHRTKMKAILDDIKGSKNVLFDKLSDRAVNRLEIDSIARAIANKEASKEIETFYFFKAVGDLCNGDQKVRFESIIKDALHRQARRDGNGPPGGPDGEHRPPPPRH